MAVTAPVVLNRFQYSEYSNVGRLAAAATAKASATRNATLSPRAKIDSTIATAPITKAATRAACTSSRSEAVPRLITLANRSCANDDEEARVSPATTARMVANATAAMTARKMEPPHDP